MTPPMTRKRATPLRAQQMIERANDILPPDDLPMHDDSPYKPFVDLLRDCLSLIEELTRPIAGVAPLRTQQMVERLRDRAHSFDMYLNLNTGDVQARSLLNDAASLIQEQAEQIARQAAELTRTCDLYKNPYLSWCGGDFHEENGGEAMLLVCGVHRAEAQVVYEQERNANNIAQWTARLAHLELVAEELRKVVDDRGGILALLLLRGRHVPVRDGALRSDEDESHDGRLDRGVAGDG